MAESSTSTHRSAASGHSIFLSHSGAQKNFVEQLCVDLESCNRSVFFDKRSDSLPKGEPFPQHIFKAIQECQVGVVVLSEEFFSSKWPMLELVAMSKRMRLGNSRLRIMPIFLSMSPVQCRDVTNHGRWLSTWCEWAQGDKRMDIEEWKEAVKLLGRMNGFYKVGLGEVKFRKEIVKEICKVVRPTTTWDDSHVEGGSRLCKIICEKLDSMQACTQARVVGVYGVGGVGKTTLCKSLCEHFFREYEGKVCHVELKEGGDKLDLLRQVLRRLANTSEKVLQGFSEDECYSLLRQNITKQKVCIAIDNVFDSSKCLEEAGAYLQLNYSPNSVVVVTARSLDQLLMVKIGESNCMEMPDLEKDEARSLFLKNLVILLLDDIAHRSSWIAQISGLTRLQVSRLDSDTSTRERKNRYPDLGRLWSLQHLTIREFYNKAKSISGFSKRMSCLRTLNLSFCSFSRCDGVGDLIALEELHLRWCKKLKELPNLERLTKLRKLNIACCFSITTLPGFGDAGCF